MPITYRTFKEDVVRGYRIGAYASSTVPTQGGTTTVLADGNRREAAGHWDRVDTWIKFDTGQPGVASVNDSAVRLITGYSTNQTITWAPALTVSVPSGSGYRLFQSFHPDNDAGLAINTTLRANFPERVVYAVATMNEETDVRSYAIASAVFNTITKLVKIERSVGSLVSEWQYRTLREGHDYTVVDYAGTGRLMVQYLPEASRVLRLTAERASQELTADTDTTDEPPNLVLSGARAFLAAQEGDKERLAYWTQRHEQDKRDYVKNRPAQALAKPHFKVS